MFRYLLLVPCLILAILASRAHDDAQQVAVEAINPDLDPRFSSIAGMDTLRMMAVDPDLAIAYVRASSAYSRYESHANLEKRRLIDQRNEYFAFMVAVFTLFGLTFLPWRRWDREMTQGGAQAVAKSVALFDNASTRVLGGERTIIKREGLDSFSVSTELKNWKELLDAGVVTREEFEDAKSKLLRKK